MTQENIEEYCKFNFKAVVITFVIMFMTNTISCIRIGTLEYKIMNKCQKNE